MPNPLTVTIPAGRISAEFELTPELPAGNRTITISSSPALTYAGSPLTVNWANPPTIITISGPSTIEAGEPPTLYTLTLDQVATEPIVITVTDSVTADLLVFEPQD